MSGSQDGTPVSSRSRCEEEDREQSGQGPVDERSASVPTMTTGGDDSDEAAAMGVFFPGHNGGGGEGQEEEEEDQVKPEAGSDAGSNISGVSGLVEEGGVTIEEVFDDDDEEREEGQRRQQRQQGQQPQTQRRRSGNAGMPAPVASVEAFFRAWLSTSGLAKTLEAFRRESAERLKRRPAGGGNGGNGNNNNNNNHNNNTAAASQTLLPPPPSSSSSSTSCAFPPTLEQQLAGALSELAHERARFARETRRLAQEKTALAAAAARLQARCEHEHAPALAELRRRYEAATREAALARLERDRALRELGGGAAAVGGAESAAAVASPGASTTTTTSSRRLRHLHAASKAQTQPQPPSSAASSSSTTTLARRRSSPLLPAPSPADAAYAPLGANLPAADVASSKPLRVCRPPTPDAGQRGGGVAAVALHPGRPLLATASDDGAWRLWQPETGALVMSGEGHKAWVCAVDFMASASSTSSASSPSSSSTPLLLATAAGDGSVKLWEPARRRCAATLHEHGQAVWAARFHPRGGPWLATASLDRTVRLWDCEAAAGVGVGVGAPPSSSSSSSSSPSSSLARSRLVLRGHADSVNDVSWDPRGGFVLATASNDRTVCVWDARTGGARPVATLGGGGGGGGGSWAPVTSVSWSPGASSLLACTDSAGTLRLLDLRAAAAATDHAAAAAGGGQPASSPTELVACRGPAGARSACFDASGAVVAVACEDGRARCYAVDGRAGQAAGALLAELDARRAAVEVSSSAATAGTRTAPPPPPSVTSVAFDRWGSNEPSKLLVAGLSDGSWVGWGQ